MDGISRQAQALILSFGQFRGEWDPEITIQELRDQDMHLMADLIESLTDQIAELKRKQKCKPS